MHSPARQQILQHSVRVIGLLRPLVLRVGRCDPQLASQLRRAASSISLNLAEGFGARGGNQRLRFESALGSLYETRTAVEVAVAWGVVSEADAGAALAALNALGGRIYGLSRT